jgi:hypothetical protein
MFESKSDRARSSVRLPNTMLKKEESHVGSFLIEASDDFSQGQESDGDFTEP